MHVLCQQGQYYNSCNTFEWCFLDGLNVASIVSRPDSVENDLIIDAVRKTKEILNEMNFHNNYGKWNLHLCSGCGDYTLHVILSY